MKYESLSDFLSGDFLSGDFLNGDFLNGDFLNGMIYKRYQVVNFEIKRNSTESYRE